MTKSQNECPNIENRFRQIPTFGWFTIRRFHNNVSEMKKLAARNFEDILQVRKHVLSMSISMPTIILASVLSQCSKAFSLSPSMEFYFGFCTRLQNGTCLLNSDCTLNLHWIFSKQLQRSLAASCDNSVARPQTDLTRWNFLVELMHEKEGHAPLRRKH